MTKNPKILVVIPSRNESERIGKCLASLVEQSLRVETVVVVDDGSEDGTAAFAAQYSSAFADLRIVTRSDRGVRSVGPGVIEAFYSGLEVVDIDEFDFVCKLDADVSIGKDYFAELMARFDADAELGAASGKVINCEIDGLRFEERIMDEQVSGAAKCYRVSVFKAIGGFVRAVMWDGIDTHRVRMLGYRSRSFRHPNLEIFHSRLMGSSYRSVYSGRLRWGRGQWFMGSAWWYVLASAVFRMAERPFVIGGFLIFIGYIGGCIFGDQRYEFAGFRESLRRWQRTRLINMMRGRGATAAVD